MRDQTKLEIELLNYVLYVLIDSRTLKKAKNRINALLQKKNNEVTCYKEYSREEINDYIRKENKE